MRPLETWLVFLFFINRNEIDLSEFPFYWQVGRVREIRSNVKKMVEKNMLTVRSTISQKYSTNDLSYSEDLFVHDACDLARAPFAQPSKRIQLHLSLTFAFEHVFIWVLPTISAHGRVEQVERHLQAGLQISREKTQKLALLQHSLQLVSKHDDYSIFSFVMLAATPIWSSQVDINSLSSFFWRARMYEVQVRKPFRQIKNKDSLILVSNIVSYLTQANRVLSKIIVLHSWGACHT